MHPRLTKRSSRRCRQRRGKEKPRQQRKKQKGKQPNLLKPHSYRHGRPPSFPRPSLGRGLVYHLGSHPGLQSLTRYHRFRTPLRRYRDACLRLHPLSHGRKQPSSRSRSPPSNPSRMATMMHRRPFHFARGRRSLKLKQSRYAKRQIRLPRAWYVGISPALIASQLSIQAILFHGKIP